MLKYLHKKSLLSSFPYLPLTNGECVTTPSDFTEVLEGEKNIFLC